MIDNDLQLQAMLVDVVLPRLHEIQASQLQQRLHTEQLNASIEAFRDEMRLRFAELHAELAACRLQVEDAMVTLREAEAAAESATAPRKLIVH